MNSLAVKRKDIAEKAGVTLTTVSRVLSGNGYVSKAKREAVEAAMRELGMDKAPLADYGEGVVILVAPPNRTNFCYYKMTVALYRELLFCHRKPVVLFETVTSQNITELIDRARSIKAEGIIFVHLSESQLLSEVCRFAELPRFQEYADYPVVFMEGNEPEQSALFVNDFDYMATCIATEYLIHEGHKRIAYIGCHSQQRFERQRLNGYRKALESNHIPQDESLVVLTAQNNIDFGRTAAQRLIIDGADCTAVVCSSDYFAYGAQRTYQENGYKVPQDISITGLFDDCTEYAVPPITTVAFPYEEQARFGVLQLLNKLSPNALRIPEIKMTPRLIIRGSTRSLI